MEIELACSGIAFESKEELVLSYKGTPLNSFYEPDFICYSKIILELKAVESLSDKHLAQVHNYLKATNMRLGLLVNFGHFPGVEIERIIR